MKIGEVIRKYRKEAGLTQEEMAHRLGVTTPAVNKWENGNSNPDIELLAPIARLLHISLDTLLSFREELSLFEQNKLIRELDFMCNSESFEAVFQWASKKIEEYPNANMLIWQTAVILDARRMTDKSIDSQKYDEQIIAWYEMALKDESSEIRRHAADSLFGFYLRKKEYNKAEEYLYYFSNQDPIKKIYQGRLYKEKGEKEKAYNIFESLIFSEYQTLNFAFSLMKMMALEDGDTKKACYYAEKEEALAAVFEMGKYHECSAMLDIVCSEKNVLETKKVVKDLLHSVDTLVDFTKSDLYQHMTFSKPDASFIEDLKRKILDGFQEDESFGYMKGNEDWERMMEQ